MILEDLLRVVNDTTPVVIETDTGKELYDRVLLKNVDLEDLELVVGEIYLFDGYITIKVY